jgi:hypothetical protein
MARGKLQQAKGPAPMAVFQQHQQQTCGLANLSGLRWLCNMLLCCCATVASKQACEMPLHSTLLHAKLTLTCVLLTQVKGWPCWPALVMTHLDADELDVPGMHATPLCN